MLKSNDTAVVGLGEESKVHEVETSRIVSSEASHYILVKRTDIDSQSSQDEEDDSQSQTSSLDMGIDTGVASFSDPIPKPEDVEPGVGPGGAWLTAARDEIEHEVRKFFRERKERLGAEDGGELSKSGLATIEKGAAATEGKDEAVVLESETSGEEEGEEAHKGKCRQEKPIIEGVMSQLLMRDDMTVQMIDQHEEQAPPVIGPSSSISKEMTVTGEVLHAQGQLSHDLLSKGESESSDPAVIAKLNNEILSVQTAINPTSSTNEEKAVENSDIVHVDTAVEEKIEPSPSIDLTATLTTQEQLKSLATSPPKQNTSECTKHDLLHPFTSTHSSVADVAQIESDEGDSPSPPATAAEEVALIESDEGDSPSPQAAGWSGSKEVEALLMVAPSDAQEQLSAEMEELERERNRQSRAAASVSNQMYKEAQVHVDLCVCMCVCNITSNYSMCMYGVDMKCVSQRGVLYA